MTDALKSRGVVAVVTLCALSGAQAAAQDPPVPPQSTHGAPDGTAWQSNDRAEVVGRTRVKILLVCKEGAVPCRGAVRLTTRVPVQTRAKGPHRVVEVLGGPYGEIAPGARKRVTYTLRSAARHHVLRHALTPTRITVFTEGSSEPVHLTIRNRVTVRNPRIDERRNR